LDPNRTPVMLARVPSTNPGVLHLDTSAVTGDAAVSVDPVLTPNNYYEPKFEVLTGGNVGVSPAGIIIRRSADEDRHYQDVELGLASVLEIPDTGIKIVFNVSEAELVALVNDIRSQYTDHIGNVPGAYHTVADATNTVTLAAATDRTTAIALINEIRGDYEAHRVLVGGGPVHTIADATNTIVAPAATTDTMAVTLANEIKAKFNLHRAQAGVHALNDADNVVTVADALPASLNVGDIITGWTEPPRCDPSTDFAALFNALKATQNPFSMICFGEHLYPADVGALQAGLTLLEQNAKDVLAIFSVRPRYKTIPVYAVSVTFADANPDTMARASGSWIADGVKVGMRVTVTGTVSNNAIFVRVATVTALTLTFSAGVAFVAEGPVSATLLFEETEDDYGTNIGTEWGAVNDTRLAANAADTRVDVPTTRVWTLDKPWSEELASKLITSPPDKEAGQVRQEGTVGGAIAVRLSARIYEGDTRIHMDAAEDNTLVLARMSMLRRVPDGRAGAFVNTGLVLAGTNDAIDTIVKARLANEWKRIVRSALTDEILSGYFADATNLNRLSEGAAQDIESRVIPALKSRFSGMLSNLNSPPPDALFTVDRESDLSTGKINVFGKIVTKFYVRGFVVTLTVTQPGQV
jgi:hypothetical protein